MARRFFRFRTPVEPDEVPSISPVLPEINQRVTVTTNGSSMPMPSRVDDEVDEGIVLASPNVPLICGEQIILTWEREDGWFSLDTSVQAVDDRLDRPTVTVSKHGRVRQHRERRSDARAKVGVPMELRVVISRVVKPGRTLRTHTVELGTKALRFTTSAPFAPGDIFELRLDIPGGSAVTSRVRVIRMDSVSDSWRHTCTAVFEEMLASDRDRIMALLDSHITV